jgi:hypothetical protein
VSERCFAIKAAHVDIGAVVDVERTGAAISDNQLGLREVGAGHVEHAVIHVQSAGGVCDVSKSSRHGTKCGQLAAAYNACVAIRKRRILARTNTNNNAAIRFGLSCARYAIGRRSATSGRGTIERDATVANAQEACRIVGDRVAEIVAWEGDGVRAKTNFEAHEVTACWRSEGEPIIWVVEEPTAKSDPHSRDGQRAGPGENESPKEQKENKAAGPQASIARHGSTPSIGVVRPLYIRDDTAAERSNEPPWMKNVQRHNVAAADAERGRSKKCGGMTNAQFVRPK